MRGGFATKLRRDARGTTLVEFALASPILIMFMLAVMQIGMTMQAYSALREVISSGGRAAMVAYQDKSDGVMTETQVEDMIKTRASAAGHRLRADDLTVDVTITDDNVLLAKKIQIDLDYDVELVIPFWKTSALTLSESRMFYVPQ